MGIIVFAMKDPGGTQCVVPVARELMARGLDVLLYAEPGSVGAKILKFEEKLLFIEDFDAILAQKPDMIVSSIDTGDKKRQNSGMTIEVTRKARETGIPVAWVQDLFGNHIKPYWDGSVKPDFFFTFNETWVREVRETWPDFPPENIFPFGQPKFDLIAKMELEPVPRAIKEQVNKSGGLVITVAAQIGGMLECFQNFINALNEIGRPVLVNFMHHGRYPMDLVYGLKKFYPDLKLGQITDYALIVSGEKGRELRFFIDRNQQLLMADVVFTMFSTDAANGSIAGKHVISCLLPQGLAHFHEEGYRGDKFFLTLDNFCLGASTYGELVEALNKVLLEPDKRHHRRIETDDQSAKRIADKIIEIVEPPF